MSTYKNLMAIAAVAALGLGLAGCGGGGSSTTTTAQTCPEGQVGTPPNCMEPAPELTTYEKAKAAIADAATAAEAQAAYDAVKDDVTAAEGEKLQALVDERREREMAQRREGNKAGELVAAAIVKANAADTNFHDATSVSAFPASIGTLSVPTIKDGGTPTITLRRTTGVKLDAMNTMSPGDGWTGKKFSFSKNMGAAFTNRSAPTVKVTEYGYGTFFDVPNTGTDTKLAGVTPDAAGVLTLGGNLLKGSHFAVTGLLPDRPTGAAVTTTAPTSPSTHTGSFLGVQGTFTCTACTVMRDKNDAITIGGTSLTFTPTKSATQEFDDLTVMYRTSTPDDDYTLFGYWMTTSGTGDKVKQTIHTFAEAMGYGAADNNALGAVGGLEGKATYSGAAAGIYVHKAGSGDSLVVGNGEFVADANLTAQFGDTGNGAVAVRDQWAVTGTVSGFQSATGSHDLSDWTLMLGKADLGTRGADGTLTPAGAGFAGFTGKTSGGTGTTPGDWVGTFVGGAPADTDTTTEDDYPEAAFGAFNGHFANGHVAGAFGAEKD